MKQSNAEICRTAQHNLDNEMPPDDDYEPEDELIQCAYVGGTCTGCKACLKHRRA